MSLIEDSINEVAIIPPISRYFTEKEDAIKAHNNGGKTDYYDLPSTSKECQDIIELRQMNFAQGNIFKVAFTFNCGRHNGTSYERDLNKIIYFAERELKRINNEIMRP